MLGAPSSRVIAELCQAVVLPDGREALVTSRVEAATGPLAALLEVVVAPSPLVSDAIA
jgi:hypothetical protein